MAEAYINGKFFHSDAEAIVVEEGIITKTGTNAEILADLDKEDSIIDLSGTYTVPGFIDTHMHLLGLGQFLTNLQLDDCESLQEVIDLLRQKAAVTKEGEWIIGRGYNEDNFPDHRRPDKAMLDAVCPNIPVSLTRACGHAMTVNSKAMELAGIDADTAVDGGRIEFETGVLEENAIPLIHKAWPKDTPVSVRKALLAGMKYCNSKGVTCAGSDDFPNAGEDYRLPLDVFEQMSYREEMTVRINEQCEFGSPKEFSEFLDDGYTTDVGNDLFRIGPLKLITDGSLGARTAAMSAPYADDPSKRGYMAMSDEEMELYVKLAARFNMPAIAHCIGDEAVDRVLAAYEDVVLEGNPLHHGIVHCQIMRPDQIRRVIEKKLVCYFQSLFIDYDASILEARAGKKLAQSCYPFKTLFEGTIACNGSDAPVELNDPLRGIQLAVTRESLRFAGCSMNKEEALSVEQAIESYTEKAAEALFMEDRLGRIAPGYYADFAVLDTDILSCDVHSICEAKVLMTIMNGNRVYQYVPDDHTGR
ncbi:MAG: amidohydrolase [Solobacterium sp.]|nr:amidohydrolase [Solobacterium sp.]